MPRRNPGKAPTQCRIEDSATIFSVSAIYRHRTRRMTFPRMTEQLALLQQLAHALVVINYQSAIATNNFTGRLNQSTSSKATRITHQKMKHTMTET